MKGFYSLLIKDVRLMKSGKFFLLSFGCLILYTLYVNFGYVKFMDNQRYNVYLYDPKGVYRTDLPWVYRISSREELDAAILEETRSVGIDAGTGEAQLILYEGKEKVDRHRIDYAYASLQPPSEYQTEIVGFYTPEQKARREITCELLFFEICSVGFLGIAAVLFREKGMGVIRIHAVLPIHKRLFLVSKLAIFLFSDLVFAMLLTILNVGIGDGMSVLPEILFQAALLSLFMALIGVICSLMLKDFRQFTLVYLLISVFAATPVFLSANTAIKFDWISFHPFYHIYMGLKNAYFGTPMRAPAYYLGYLAAIAVLFLAAWRVFDMEMKKEG